MLKIKDIKNKIIYGDYLEIMKIYQRKYGEEYHTLYVIKSKDGWKITCECISQLFNPKRNYQSNCKHAKDLLSALKENNLSKYIDVTPKRK